MTSRKWYVEYIEAAVREERPKYEASVAAWRKSFRPDEFLGMYTPPGNIPIMAQIEGFLFAETGEREYGEEAKRLILAVEQFKDIVPEQIRRRHPEYEQGVPSFEPMFQGIHFVQGYLYVKDSGLFSPEEKAQVEESIRSAVRAVWHFAEWGPHNRSMLRAHMLSLSIAALGDTEETREWAKLRDYLAQASIGAWSIEDAELYLPLWLSSCAIVAERTGTEREYYAKPQTKYYFDYIVRLLTPYGQLPDFGDSDHHGWWWLWLACLEKGAAAYRCGHMKYAAGLVLDYAMSYTQGPPSAYLAAFFTYACQWMDEDVEPVRPDWLSGEALEDMIGKKIVFRNGWNADDAYMLLNYRDEGDYALVARDYMRRTVNAPAEKVHHGHADENSISLLASRRNILLHDGGYRDGAPNGKYRADIYHNRLVFRDGRPGDGSLYDFVHDDGVYHRVSAEKLHFQSFGEVVYSRTRVTDPYRGFLWDRAVVYLPDEEVYLIADWTKALSAGSKTIANLWHPGSVLEAGDGWYVCQVPHIYLGAANPVPLKVRKEMALLIEFPGSARTHGRETIRRCYGDSEMVYEWEAFDAAEGAANGFVTALTPFAAGTAAPAGRVTTAEFSPDCSRLTLVYEAPKRTYRLAFKLDLEQGTLEQPEYPKYAWESGRLAYGPLDTDADFAFVSERDEGPGRYGFVNGCGVVYRGRELYRTPRMSGYSFKTKEYWPVDHKWRAWDGSFE